MMRKAISVSIIWIISLWATIASAHSLPPVVADTYVGDEAVEMKMALPLEELIVDSRVVFENADPYDMLAEYDRLRGLEPEALEEAFRPYADYFAHDFVIKVGDETIQAEYISSEIPSVGDVTLPRESILMIRAELPAGDVPVQIGWGDQNGDLVIRQQSGDASYAGYLVRGQLSDPLPRDGELATSSGSSFVNYIVIGFEHIIPKGLDHILFVLGLFFFALAWRPLLWQVTAFTIAHSITLILASLGYVNVPASVVEPLIALSIAVVALENIFGDGAVNKRRIIVIIFFGLLHGLGFASVLGEIGLDPLHLLLSLIAFNIGVEIGQLAVIAGAFLILGLPFGRKSWYRAYIAIPASVIIALIGLYWFVERIFLG